MRHFPMHSAAAVVLLSALAASAFHPAWAAEEVKKGETEASKEKAAKKEEQKFPKWDDVIKGAEAIKGLFTLYFNKKEQKLLLEVSKSQYDKELILPIAISRGSGWYLGGDTLNFGGQWIIAFRRAGDRLLVIRKNTRVHAKKGTPQADAVKLSHNDSVILALPIKSEKDNGGKVLVDLADLFMTDLPRLGVSPDRNRSTWASVKAFPKNVEIEVNIVFTSPWWSYWFFGDDDTPDPRGTQIGIHYGLSLVPKDNGYKPRLADDRVGHFLSTIDDFSRDTNKTPRVRYVTRWRLEKANPDEDLSPPKEPIIFWIEKTVPREYRPYVKAGILEWNKAFEKVGFVDAIQVRDQQSRDEFDPEDIRYNTFRWITTTSAFAMGPSRTNPRTGQILDADILFDESMVRYWRREYLTIAGLPESIARARHMPFAAWARLHVGDLADWVTYQPAVEKLLQRLNQAEKEHSAVARHAPPMAPATMATGFDRRPLHHQCQLGRGMQRQLGLLAAVLHTRGKLDPGGKVPKEFIGQAIKEVTMHEVGHTLGLRHNFKASTMLSLEQCNDPNITRQKGMAGSVMDYLPANIAVTEEKQGDYFSQTIGPYDYWAIEYAYKPVKGDEALAKIASRAPEPELAYGTDEDLYMSPDPRINLYDLGDPLEYAQQRIELVKHQIDDLAERVVAEGEGWQRTRDAFNNLFGELYRASYLTAQYVGGEYNHRDHRGDPNARPPFEPIPVEKQREAMKFLADNILSGSAFRASPELLKRLAPEYWRDNWWWWYTTYQYPYVQQVLSVQRVVIRRFLDSNVMRSIQNAELHADDPSKVLTLPEVFDVLTDNIWSELPADGKPEGKLDINRVRRNLQREHVRRLSHIVIGPRRPMMFGYGFVFGLWYDPPAPPDGVALARAHLEQIAERIDKVLTQEGAEISDYARAHLSEIRQRIEKVLEASLEINNV